MRRNGQRGDIVAVLPIDDPSASSEVGLAVSGLGIVGVAIGLSIAVVGTWLRWLGRRDIRARVPPDRLVPEAHMLWVATTERLLVFDTSRPFRSRLVWQDSGRIRSVESRPADRGGDLLTVALHDHPPIEIEVSGLYIDERLQMVAALRRLARPPEPGA
ncbi:MAG: hypothetical protein AB7L17_08230 [Ilumatobacteraceae bacterium]